MSSDPNSPPSVLAATSVGFAVAASVGFAVAACAFIFAVTPKGVIGFVAALSIYGGAALSAIGIVLGLCSLTPALIDRKGRWRLAAFGVFANAILLVYFLGNYCGFGWF